MYAFLLRIREPTPRESGISTRFLPQRHRGSFPSLPSVVKEEIRGNLDEGFDAQSSGDIACDVGGNILLDHHVVPLEPPYAHTGASTVLLSPPGRTHPTTFGSQPGGLLFPGNPYESLGAALSSCLGQRPSGLLDEMEGALRGPNVVPSDRSVDGLPNGLLSSWSSWRQRSLPHFPRPDLSR